MRGQVHIFEMNTVGDKVEIKKWVEGPSEEFEFVVEGMFLKYGNATSGQFSARALKVTRIDQKVGQGPYLEVICGIAGHSDFEEAVAVSKKWGKWKVHE